MKKKLLALPAAVGLLGLLVVGAQSTNAATPAPPAPVTTKPAPVDLSTDSIGFDAPAQTADQAILTYLQANPDLNGGIITHGPTDLTIALMPSITASADLSQLVKAAQAVGVTVKYSTAAHSLAELNADVTKICLSSLDYVTCGLDMQTDSVAVTAATDIPALSQYGNAATLKVQPGLTAKLDSGRFGDTAPYNGGDAIFVAATGAPNGGLCTTGFKLHDSAGNQYGITAGHCAGVGVSGDYVLTMNSNAAGAWIGSTYSGTMGTESFNDLISVAYCNTHNCYDASIIGGSFSNKDWIGGSATSTKQAVTSATNVVVGTDLLADGANTGQSSVSQVTAGPIWFNEEGTHVPVYQAVTLDASIAVNGGDSGGPVIGPDGHGGLIGVGIITAGDDLCSGGSCVPTDVWYYTSLPSILTAFGSSLN